MKKIMFFVCAIMLSIISFNLILTETNNILAYCNFNLGEEGEENQGAAPLFSNNEGNTTIFTEDDCTFSNFNKENKFYIA